MNTRNAVCKRSKVSILGKKKHDMVVGIDKDGRKFFYCGKCGAMFVRMKSAIKS